jgi:hypothetical protein
MMVADLHRVAEIGGLGAGAVVTEPVPAVKLSALARYGLAAKAPTLRDLEGDRQAATLLATVRHLETSSVDDALDVLDLLITSNLLARAGKAEQLRTFPKLRKAARTMASSAAVLMSAPEATEAGVAGGGVEGDRGGDIAREAGLGGRDGRGLRAHDRR